MPSVDGISATRRILAGAVESPPRILVLTTFARRLSITEGTVKTHPNRLMAKLHITSRAQAVVVAYESGLVSATGRWR